jgi:DNA-directed RNA polymerase subunit H (RpoH/RPB5)
MSTLNMIPSKISKTFLEMKEIIYFNILRMFEYREWLDEKQKSSFQEYYVENPTLDTYKLENTIFDKDIIINFISDKSYKKKYTDNDEVHTLFILINNLKINKLGNILQNNNVEFWEDDELYICLADHCLNTTVHSILSEENKNKFLYQYNIELYSLLQLYLNDPMRKYLNAKVGDIIKLIRPNFSIIYKLVVNKIYNHKK